VTLRTTLFPPLAAIANRWNEAIGLKLRFPDVHADFLDRWCRQMGLTLPMIGRLLGHTQA
jgi:hypothetical protein